ncbi:MAG: hypothetical protein JO204_01650 [Alphaproteobacteria bacterium]|nr:hypothetical protein [Alphaproteobacteria bacterium]
MVRNAVATINFLAGMINRVNPWDFDICDAARKASCLPSRSRRRVAGLADLEAQHFNLWTAFQMDGYMVLAINVAAVLVLTVAVAAGWFRDDK